MKILATSNATPITPCQPIKPEYSSLSFSKRKVPAENKDTFTSKNDNLALKYRAACQLAAFYKKQYENLIKTGGVVA